MDFEKITIKKAFDNNNHAFVFATDNNYFKYFAVALQSLIENSNKNVNYDIIVLETNISDENKNKLKGVGKYPSNFSVRYFNLKDIIEKHLDKNLLVTKHYITIETYYRFFIPLLMKDYDKDLYCDVDICFNGNVDELFEINMQNKEIAAIPDGVTYLKNSLFEKHRETLNLKNYELYFNAGIMLINIEKIDANKFLNDFISLLISREFMFLDQDILNIMYDNDKKKILDYKYNFQVGSLEYLDDKQQKFPKEYLNTMKTPLIIHYTFNKPLNNECFGYAKIWRKYAKKSVCKNEIIKIIKKSQFKNFLQTICSVKNHGDCKVCTIFGFKIKYRKK